MSDPVCWDAECLGATSQEEGDKVVEPAVLETRFGEQGQPVAWQGVFIHRC